METWQWHGDKDKFVVHGQRNKEVKSAISASSRNVLKVLRDSNFARLLVRVVVRKIGPKVKEELRVTISHN